MHFLIVLTILVGVYVAWNIGANDVANAMGTSVGSKALTLRRAVIVAAVLEFSGAFFLGSHVSETIQEGIIKVNIFQDNFIIFALGMLASLIATGIWLNIASYFGLPISTTHSIVGSILGFGIIIGGLHAVNWLQVLLIVIGWLTAPLLSSAIAYFIFAFLQRKILFAFKPLAATKKTLPFFVFFVFFIFSLSLLLNSNYFKLKWDIAFSLAILIALVFSLISYLLAKKIKVTAASTKKLSYSEEIVALEKTLKHLKRLESSAAGENREKINQMQKRAQEMLQKAKEKVKFIGTTSEYLKVEKIFGYLQIASACLVAFAHGANDVANAIGPISAVIQSIRTQNILTDAPIATWVLALGGFGIVVGLATWGWRVIETVGRRITELTPTRGFSAEIGAAASILLASKLGLPISTTHALIGAVLGVGIAKGIQALNLRTITDIITSWLITIPTCAILSIVSYHLLKLVFYP